ncbi:MAG TPA: thioredoxin family protein [Clostridia bacterium]|nr:thioredoxin family protein [Clostridia bacterium]
MTMDRIRTMAQLDTLKAKHSMVLVYFSTEGCGVCKSLLPRLTELLLKYPDIRAVKADLSDAPELSASFSIFTVPAVILFVMGKETLREAGFISLAEIARQIAKYNTLLNSRL